jgi:hypothetical protein
MSQTKQIHSHPKTNPNMNQKPQTPAATHQWAAESNASHRIISMNQKRNRDHE